MGFQLNTLIFAAIVLLISLVFDDIRYQIIKRRRKHQQIH
jgi:multidrug efflux pump subunit AcrB